MVPTSAPPAKASADFGELVLKVPAGSRCLGSQQSHHVVVTKLVEAEA